MIEPLEKFVPFSPPSIGSEEIAEVVDTLESGWITTGPKTERFENNLARYVGAGRAVAVNSCTAALHLALSVLEIGPGDAVITSPFTFASTAHVVMYLRARPVLVDIEPGTFNIDPARIRQFLENECRPGGKEGRRRIKATGETVKTILPVHYGGHPCRMDEIKDLAREFNLSIVEDAAHALGSTYNNQKIGAIGDITCFSFYATKNLTTAEGGMALTDNEELADRMRVLSMYGISDARRIWSRYAPKGSWVYDVTELGFKYNMTDIQAAIGLHQLAKLDGFIQRRAENAAIYDHAFSGMETIRTPLVENYCGHSWHLYPILLETGPEPDRDAFIETLKDCNIGTSVLFIPLHLHSHYQKTMGWREGSFPISEYIFRRIVNLPISPGLEAQTATRVAQIVAGLADRWS